MRVLIALHPMMDLGGIVNNMEGLYAGFRQLGHDVEVRLLEWKRSHLARGHSRKKLIRGRIGLLYDQQYGWRWPDEMRMSYGTKLDMKRWKRFASKFDLIVWQIPVPTKHKENFGNTDWIDLYDVPVKQVIHVHDGNFAKRYPWLYAVRRHLAGAALVHPCAYHAVAGLGLPRALVLNPQIGWKARMSDTPYGERYPGFMCLQMFKKIKRVDDLVRAIPHMEGVDHKMIAGGGIEYHYMTSETKVKQEYLASVEKDPNMRPEWDGQPIWDIAVDHGLDYLGFINNKKRDAYMSKLRLLIDPSWSHSYASYGDLFNRVIVEGLIMGCVPVSRNLGLSAALDGKGDLFKAGENFIMIPWDATPKQFADVVSEAANMPRKKYRRMLEAGRELLPLFDCKVAAQAFIDLARGKPAGYYRTRGLDKYDPKVEELGDKELNTFFAGIKPEKKAKAAKSRTTLF